MHDVMPRYQSHAPFSDQRGGFTLLEVVVAMTVFAIGLLATNMMQTASIKGNSSASYVSQSSNWAAGKMEEIISWPYDDSRLQDDGNPVTNDGTDSSPDGAYTIAWKVTNNLPIASTKTIVITVSWNVRGATKTSQFTVIKASTV